MPTLVVCDQCGQIAMVLFAMADLATQRHNAACLAPQLKEMREALESLIRVVLLTQQERE
jgi:predicted nucleic acid-binding Zn ribbon protein